jgi:hypothetical protein
VSACHVNDAETPESQTYATADEDAFVIRSAMDDCLRHAMHELAWNLALLIEFKYSANAAHFCCSFF